MCPEIQQKNKDATESCTGPVTPAPVSGGTRLWNRSFLFLWIGQAVSAVGDVVYAIALGFWILAVTGSTSLMGALMAASSLPRVLVSPFAGVIVDRGDRKSLLIIMDLVRGAAVVAVGIAALAGSVQIWMVFAAGILIGLGGAFFNPAVGSVIPDIIPVERIVPANAVFNMIYTGSGLIGNAAGGFLFKILGAPLLFLFNGISYLVSAATVLLVRIPAVVKPAVPVTFFRDLKEGLKFVWQFRGLRSLMIMAGALNFFAVIGITLMLPLFQRHEQLGPARYGIVMAFFGAGLLAGFLLTSLYQFKPESRFKVFVACCVAMSIGLMLFPLFLNVIYMSAIVLAVGAVNSVLNSFISAIAQMTVPQDRRGKVFGLMATISGGLTPLAFASAGVLAEFIPLRPLITGCFAVTLLVFMPLFFDVHFKKFVNYDPQRQTLADLM
jgi:MFS family permease